MPNISSRIYQSVASCRGILTGRDLHMKRAVIFFSGLLFLGGAALAQSPELVRISRFSGKPVPRFETLKYAMVNGRAGPSKDYPVLWEYQRQGLPMLVIKESSDWRRVRDPSGAEVWMHERMLEDGHMAYVRTPTVLRMDPGAEATPVVDVGRGVLVQLGDCDAGWCLVRAKDYRGYAPQATLWGADAEHALE